MTNVCIQKKDLKDEKYLKSNILSVNYKHYERERSFPYYRFMGQPEFETLLQEKILYFTNPEEWKKSVTGMMKMKL